MDLILWRHADSVELDDPHQDAERPLTAKGKRQAERMANWLNQHLPDTTRILVSPTRRTLQTAEALGRKFKEVDALGPEPRTGYEVSYPLFGDDLRPAARRFAVAETLSHLERLVRDGRAERHEAEHDGAVVVVSYTAAQ